MTYIQNMRHFRGFKLTFTDWYKFRFIEELTYKINVWFHEKFLTDDALCLITAPSLVFWLGHFLRQLHFPIYYLFVALIFFFK
jgi:hypothetical protein